MPLSVVTLRDFRVRLGITGILLLGALLATPRSARAEGEDPAAIEKITDLNKKALDAYNNLDFEDARKLLKQALDLSSSAGLEKHPIKARTHIHMGVVLIATKQEELGIKQFRKALEIQPDIQVTKALANPEIVKAFSEAAATPGSAEGGESGGSEAPSPPNAAGSQSSEVAGDITLVPVTRARRGKPVPISVVVNPDFKGYTKVVLAYRAEGAPEFIGVDMSRSGNKFTGEIPAEATNGSVVHYYVEAETDDEEPVTTNGTEEKPYAIALSTGGSSANNEQAEPSEGDGDGDEEGGKFFVSLSGGTGLGYATGTGELNVANHVNAGFAPASAVQIVPEVGYFLSSRLRLSLQARFQYVTGRTPLNLNAVAVTNPGVAINSCGADHICSTGSPIAPSVFARATWFFGSSTFRPYFSLALGGGIIRHVVKFKSEKAICGAKGDQVCVDSVLAGPIFAGPGGGIHIALTPALGLIAEVNSVIGMPKFTFHFDFNGGVAARF
jgi:hypothetical protein